MNFNYKKLKKQNSTYIIAEAGVNHECSISKAKKLILLAKKGGADAIKFQAYKINQSNYLCYFHYRQVLD